MRTVEVRPASREDLLAVVALSSEARDESPAAAQLGTADQDRLLEHLSVLLSVDGHVLVALVADEVVGVVVARVVGPYLFAGTPSLYIDLVYVVPAARRRGVGHALLRGVADLAAAHDCAEVYAAPVPGHRGIQRFLARLGFAPTAGHRVVSCTTLHRRLVEAAAAARETAAAGSRGRLRQGARGLEDLIARRRRARSVAESGPIDLRELRAVYREDHRAEVG
ncbi:GNAT family N-acetyltransferase [Antribacter gilvus]|uniref:GNAT family N-acetyltransferase n=1 Tax=Antribacter gilvus TaxID=2304675 RepID=UPI0013DFD344|nr:GNAT family N-acetyltransferase [Antribacter gilvus]